MTYLELINAVLRRLREDQAVTITDSEYVELIGAIVNEAKNEVEESWNWSHLRTYIDVTTVGGTATYNLTGSNSRTRILDVYNLTSPKAMGQYHSNVPTNWSNSLAATSQSSAARFDVVGVDSATGELQVRLWPTPEGVETIRFYAVVPQADLAASGTILKVPSEPVVQGAYLRAINERGEDQGRLSQIQENLYKISLGNHIAMDHAFFTDETQWLPI